MTAPDLHAKACFTAFRDALYDCDRARLPDQLQALFDSDCPIRLAQPIGDVRGPLELFEKAYAPLLDAMPDLERREYVLGGASRNGEQWIGCGGFYTGVFEKPWLDIPATRHLVTMRYIEFFRIECERIVEAKLLWDIPALIMQAGAWPMAPSLGVEMHVPGPATPDGINTGKSDSATSRASFELVDAMLEGLHLYATGGTEAMQLERYWHPKFNWYGPAGIGSNRRVSGFRNWHQIPFLDAMPDRISGTRGDGFDCYFADGNYVFYCGWPSMHATLSGDGWLGTAPSGQRLAISSLDIWRCENGLIRENWVLIDMLDIWQQLGVDVMRRMREVTFSRQPADFKP